MARYHGGKLRVAPFFKSFIEEKLSLSDVRSYCEPFAGMLSIFNSIDTSLLQNKEVLLSDNDKEVITMWKYLKAHPEWEPPNEVSREEFTRLRFANELCDEEEIASRCFIGHQYSFGGVYYASFSPQKDTRIALTRIRAISKKLNDTHSILATADYKDVDTTDAVIYCDPPYKGTECRFKTRFDHEAFWDWCRFMSRRSNHVFVSEYNAPDDVECIYSHPTRNYIRGRQACNNEKLFYLPARPQ